MILDVKSDNNCNYNIVSCLLDKREENHTLVCQDIIKVLKTHKESYTRK